MNSSVHSGDMESNFTVAFDTILPNDDIKYLAFVSSFSCILNVKDFHQLKNIAGIKLILVKILLFI